MEHNREYPKRLQSGRWQDINGNSYGTLMQAAKAQASAVINCRAGGR